MNRSATVSATPRRVPTLPSAPVIGAAAEIRRDYLATVLRAARDVGDIARINAGPPGWRTTFYSVSSPAAVPHVLGQPDLYVKQTAAYQEVRQALGNGMLTSEGDEWR